MAITARTKNDEVLGVSGSNTTSAPKFEQLLHGGIQIASETWYLLP